MFDGALDFPWSFNVQRTIKHCQRGRIGCRAFKICCVAFCDTVNKQKRTEKKSVRIEKAGRIKTYKLVASQKNFF